MEASNKSRASLLLAAALVFSACSFSENKAVSATNTCKRDLECGEGSVCRDNLCISTLTSPLQIALQVFPTSVKTVSGGGKSAAGTSTENAAVDQSVTTLLPHSRVSGSTELVVIKVPPLVEVSGDIRGNTDEGITARIDFVPMKSYPGIQVQTLTVNTAAQEAETKINSLKEPSDFVTQLLQNVSYNITITPQDKLGLVASSELPPFYGEFMAEKKQGSRLDVYYSKYPMEETTFRLHDLPSNRGFKVYAVSTSDTEKRVSTEKRLAPGDGEVPFSLRFSTQRDSYQLVIEPDMTASSDESDHDFVYPTFRINEGDLQPLRPDSERSTSDGGETRETQPTEITIPSQASAKVYNGYIEPCIVPSSRAKQTQNEGLIRQGARTLRVELSSKLPTASGLSRYLSATAVAVYNDKSNPKRFEFTVEAIPGNYQVVVTPPPDSGCAVFAKTMQLSAPSDDESTEAIAIQLPLVTYITGVFQTPEGEPLIGAKILAQALKREGIDVSDQPSLTAYNSTREATTDEKGAFQIPVDLGSYDLIAKPPAESGFGWQVFYDVNIGVRSDFYLKIEVANPVRLSGKVAYLNSLEKPDALQGTEIRAFAILGTRIVQIASATADQESRFQVLLSGVLKQGLY